ncbi:TMF family protein [Acetobacter ghanensis]|uniref:Uncharacterized protein n=1 Tax=Acetobacter ghanensis TaxID=431306 RepID=A0A0U5BHX6_9PROT|nr:TMF family protein [Acetobacter ghanensis]NHO39436.1 hypothetical protein [Acetobacter ghanensis]GBQ46525.1 hypothetical protein AA18895_0791 [Acetobacter ghanensis DSM 18895]CEF54572.1 hypothetical protein predicted by Glimmer/Critica [Acetobacter ghanensis]
MTDQKPTGVFVQFPLAEAQVSACSDARAKAGVEQGKPTTTSTFEAALLAIGTPVQGGELGVVDYFEYAPEYHDQGMGCGLEDRNIHDRYEAMSYGWDQALERACSEFPETVLQSDALAKLAEKDAEIARLREALESLENANNNLCFMRSNDTYQSMMRDGCGDLLAKLDDARRAAREALKDGAA